MGQSPPSSSYNSNADGLPFFQGKVDFGEVYPNVRVYCNQPTRVAEAGDILMSVRAPVGPTNLARERCCIGRGLGALRPRNELDTKFLLYFLRFREPRIAALGKGSTFEAINRDDLEELEIPLPELSEQRRIAERLEQADGLRRTRRYALELSATFLPAAFLQLFGDPVRNTKGWPTETTGELGKVVTGGTPSSEKTGMFGGDIPFITPGDLEVNTLQSQRFLTEAGANETGTVRSGATLVCCIGATIGKTDKARTVSAFNQQINAVEWDERIDDDYGLQLLRFFSPVVAERGRSTTLPILKKSAFEEIIVPVPPLALQQQFAGLVARVERLRAVQRESLRQAEHLFQSLLHRAFTL